MMIIRPIELKDIDKVFNHAYQLAMRTGVMSPDFVLTKDKLLSDLFGNQADWHGLVIDDYGRVLGSCLYSFANTNRAFNLTPCLFLDILFVEAEYQRMGLGKMLMANLKKIAQEKDITRIEFWCMKDNINSIEFYKSIGAKKIDLLNIYNLSAINN